MNEAERMFKQEVCEKKRIGYGARNKKNGSKSKKCTLPSDHLTRKEKAKLNGEVATWNMRVFYSVEEFKAMPHDIQVEYINSIMNRYDVGLSTISKFLFGKGDTYLSVYFKRTGDIKFLNIRNGGRRKGNAKAFEEDVLRARSVQDVPKHIATDPFADEEIASAEPITEAPKPKVSISEFLICMDKFDDDLWNRIKDLFGDSENLAITVSVSKES